jgi:hypothetical protein
MIIILFGLWGSKRVFRVKSTGQLDVLVVLERAALKLAHLNDSPELVGITIEDVLTLPTEVQHLMGFHAEETGDEFEPGFHESHYRNEHLVKPQAAREDEIAAYIKGYMEAQYEKGVSGVRENPSYLISCMKARTWAHIFLRERRLVLSTFIEEMVEKDIQFNLCPDEKESEEDI